MPRSSRHKSHKQHKHSSKEAKEYSDSEEVGNLKDRKNKEDVVTRVSKESASSEKRKLASQSLDGKEVFNPGNSEEFSVSKRRKEKSDASGGDRWTSGDGRGGDKESKGESSRVESEKGLKSKVSVDSKSSKSSRRHESSSEKKDVNTGLVADSQEVKRSSSSSKAESRSKSESRKEAHQYKDSKDKERVAERSTKSQDVRQERSVDKGTGKGVVDSEGSRKQSSHFEERSKPEVGNTEWPPQEDLRNPESEKELEKRTRKKRDGSDEKDKHSEDVRDSNGKKLSTKDERHKDEKHKDEKHKDDRYKDKYRDDIDRDRARDHKNRDDRVRDDRTSKDHMSERSDSRHSRDEIKASGEYRHKKSKTQNSDHDGSPHHVDDRTTRYKDYRGKKRSPGGEDDRGEIKSRSTKEHRYEVEKKANSSSKAVESLPDRGRSQSRLADGDSITSGSRRKASPSSGSHYPKDNFRHSSKQSDVKYKESMSEERGSRANANSLRESSSVSGVLLDRACESQPMEKPKPTESPVKKEQSPILEAQVSPMQLKEKSHSSTSIERRPLSSSRTPVRRNSDANEDREWPLEKQVVAEADGADSASASSSFNRTNSSSLLPPPPPTRTSHENNSSSVFYEDDTRGKPVINRYRRSVEPNRRSSVEPSRRSSVEPWKGIQTWAGPVANGYLPFQQGPPPGGFHPMMQQFHGHGPPIFRPPPGGYHIADPDTYSIHGRPFGWRNRLDESHHMHSWDGGNNNNGPFGDESHHMYSKQDSWDPNRHMMNDRNWEGQNTREDNHFRPPGEDAWVGKPGQRAAPRNERSRSVTRAESIEIKMSDDVSLEQTVPTESSSSPKPVVEKNIEPSKVFNSGFCRYYLSKLDISVDLTQPDLYNECSSLLDMEGKSAIADITKELSTEEYGKARLNVSNEFLNAPIFPNIKDSLLKNAMSLYKKQRDEMKAKYPVSKIVLPTNGGDEVMVDAVTQEPDAHLKEEGKDDAIPTSIEANEEEVDDDVVLAVENEKADNSELSYPIEEKMDESESVSGTVGPVPESVSVMVGPVPDVGNNDPVEQEVAPPSEVKMDPDADMENHAVTAAAAAIKVENVELAAAEEDDANYSLALIGEYSDEGTKFFSDETSRCGGGGGESEALLTGSIDDECKSVNLSRIHSPESTH